MEDSRIIDLFFERSEEAINALDKKYGGLCYRLSHQILNNRLDAEECVNDAYLGMWNTIPPERPNPLRAFLCKIVRNLSLKRYHANTAAKRNSTYDVAMAEVEGVLASPDTVEGEIEAKELARELEQFLDRLTSENRVLFLRRYWFADTYEEIGKQMGMTQKNVSVRLARLRKQLREYLAERGLL